MVTGVKFRVGRQLKGYLMLLGFMEKGLCSSYTPVFFTKSSSGELDTNKRTLHEKRFNNIACGTTKCPE